MTKQEAIKSLNDTKVYVNGKIEEIQEALFLLGFKWWSDGSQKVKKVTSPFLFLHNGEITYDNMISFTKCSYREITPEDILNITIEDKYRPFTSPVECFEEMSNHLPFGWVKRKNVYGDYILLTHICTAYDFEDGFNKYTFADGEPFGIRED